MAKLGERTPSRLGRLARPQEEEARPNLIRRSSSPKPKSFRLKPSDLSRLQDIVARVEEVAGRRINDVEIIRSLLVLGEKISSEKLIAGIKEASF